jgi:hypothetical protein
VNAPKDIPEVSGVTRNHIDLIAAVIDNARLFTCRAPQMRGQMQPLWACR